MARSDGECFAGGQTVVWRSVHHNQVRTVNPLVVVEDDPDQIVLFMPPGTRYMRRAGRRGAGPSGRMMMPGAPFEGHIPVVWHSTRKLVVHTPGDAHSVLLFWDDATSEFLQWYVNLEDPWRRTSIGFDSRDHVLDIAVAPDFSWQLKDEDEFEWAQEVGYFTSDEARAIRAEADRVIARVEKRESPFDQPWPAWRPDPTWPIPEVMPGWGSFFA